MGASISTATRSKHEELLMQLGGPKQIEQQDLFWKQLFMFGAQLSAVDPAQVERVLAPFTADIVANNSVSHNFQSLVLHAISLMNDARTGKNRRAAANALCLVRCVVKHVIESGASYQLPSLFQIPPGVDISQELLEGAGPSPLMRVFVRRLFATVAETDVNESTYALVYEVLLTVLVFASTQLFVPSVRTAPGTQPLLEQYRQQSELSSQVVQRLLQLFITRPAPPSGALWLSPTSSSSASSAGSQASSDSLATRAARTFFWLPPRSSQPSGGSGTAGGTGVDGAAGAAGVVQRKGPPLAGGPLCESALLLLLLLVHEPDDTSVNPFKYSLYNLQDADNGHDPEAGQALGVSKRYAHVRFSELHGVLAAPGGLTDEASCLLLYSLLHGCKSFQDYMLSRLDLESLVVPVCKMLYDCPRTAPNLMYMLQVLLLILSQDNSFSQNVHRIVVPSVPWYTEQVLNNVPLGSLVFIVLLRTVAANASCHRRDLFLPTNALAAIANMAPHVACIGSVAAQRLVGLCQGLSRRYVKLSNALAAPPAAAAGAAGAAPADTGDQEAELAVLEEFLRILLEVINAVLLPSVQRNLELLYALLHRQEALTSLKGHPRLGEHIRNLQLVVDFFNRRLDDAKAAAPNDDWSVKRVLKLVGGSAPYWRPDGIVAFPEQRFVYEEEPCSDEFFVPYVWQLVTSHVRGVPWNVTNACIWPTPAAGSNEAKPEVLVGQTNGDARR